MEENDGTKRDRVKEGKLRNKVFLLSGQIVKRKPNFIRFGRSGKTEDSNPHSREIGSLEKSGKNTQKSLLNCSCNCQWIHVEVAITGSVKIVLLRKEFTFFVWSTHCLYKYFFTLMDQA